ncbi:MAG: hypothetical protein NTZ20_05430 [Candidatus Levybacteria bacterium]|nr:hypothetical protein [Candidatus Levybacteria bacterium]
MIVSILWIVLFLILFAMLGTITGTIIGKFLITENKFIQNNKFYPIIKYGWIIVISVFLILYYAFFHLDFS